MKQTAVEWLVEEMNNGRYLTDTLIEQANKIFEQQIIDAGNTCAMKQHLHNDKVNKMTMDELLEFANKETITFGEQYYNETFKKNKMKNKETLEAIENRIRGINVNTGFNK